MEGRLTVWTEAKIPVEAVSRFSIFEAMSHPFEVDLFIRSRDVSIDFDKVVNHPASFRIDSGLLHAAEPRRMWSGVVSHMEQLRPEPETFRVKGLSTYLMRIVPRLWLLKNSTDNRLFRHKSIPDIVKEVLAEWDIEPECKLTKPADHYLELEYVVQYGESDFDFVSRLLERAGITYFFTHKGDEPTKLTLADEPHRGVARAPLDWEDRPTEQAQIEFCTNTRLSHRVKPGKVTLRDYDFHLQADFKLIGESEPAPDPERSYEHYRYEPGGFRVKDSGGDPFADEQGQWPFRHTPDEGQRRAQRLLESLRRGKRSLCFDSNCVGLCPGRVFSMEGHPREDLASEATLLVTEYSLDGDPNEKWLFTGEAVFTDVPYQPAHKTPRPRMAGIQSAIVVGEGQEEIYPDEYGRVKAQLHWDRKGKFDEKSACWMRVSQQWAGSAFGTMFIPRVKNEVLVSYFDGDPDMPVIIGRAYNVTRPVPYKLPEHHEKSLWKTKTSPEDSSQSNAYNELRFDDMLDNELIYIQAQKDYQQLVKRNETERTGHNRALVVGRHRTSVVAKVDAHLIGEKYSVQVIEEPDKGKTKVEDKTELKIIPQLKPELTPLPTKIEMIHKRLMATAGKATMVLDDKDIVFNAKGGELSFKAGGSIVIHGGPNIKINC